MIYFQKPETPDHQWVIYENHDLHGYVADKDDDGDIVLYTREDAEEEIYFFKDLGLSMVNKNHYQENYKVFQNGDHTRTEGKTPKERI